VAQCERDPSNERCFLAGVNIYGQFQIEMDGKFGPYHMCNPVQGEILDNKDWVCLQYCETPPHCDPWSAQHDRVDWMGPTCYCERANKTVGRVQRTSHYHGGHHGNPPPPPEWWPGQAKCPSMVPLSSGSQCETAPFSRFSHENRTLPRHTQD
jgi:hypothetical protein